ELAEVRRAKSPALRNRGKNIAADRENADPAMPQTPVGDDACIVPGTLRRRRAPRAGSPAQEPPLRGGWPPKRACGRSKSRPYESILCFGPAGTAAATRTAAGRDALIPPDPAGPQTLHF